MTSRRVAVVNESVSFTLIRLKEGPLNDWFFIIQQVIIGWKEMTVCADCVLMVNTVLECSLRIWIIAF